MDGMTEACGRFLARIPESKCDPAKLAKAISGFGFLPEEVNAAAEIMPEYHNLGYRGVRLLISACIDEFVNNCFCVSMDRLCEVTVPAPLSMIMTFQEAAEGSGRFATVALFFWWVVHYPIHLLLSRPHDIYHKIQR